MVLGIVMLAGLTAFGIPESIESISGIESAGVLLATSPMWFVIKDGKKEFKVLSFKALELDLEEMANNLKIDMDRLTKIDNGLIKKLNREKLKHEMMVIS